MPDEPVDTTRVRAPDWKQWTEMLVGLAAVIGAILSVFKVDNDLARMLGFTIAGVIIAVVALRLYWKSQRTQTQEERNRRIASWQTLQARSAFRGLYAYTEGDVLPGETRRREAHTLATQILNPDFSFGIIAGEVGCGKTSLLQCGVAHYVRERGASLLLIRSPRQLAIATHITTHAGATLYTEMLRNLILQFDDLCKKPTPVAIIDQFEEFLIDSPTDSGRLELGRICQGFLVRGGRILVAVRHDYLLDMHDLAPAIPDPISTPSLYPLRNFRAAEATQIILECAANDNIAISPGLASSIATDLAQGGIVRPPELQVVCTALAGDLTRDRYDQLGGARGIISDYIKTAVAVCPEPNIAKLVLRALCDFEASPPAKSAPQTAEDLTSSLTSRDSSTEKQVEQVLQVLQKARITVATKTEKGPFVHALVHDYLVSAVALATSEISTRTEDADRLLSFYTTAHHSDPRIRIPMRKLLQIQSDASPGRLQGESVARLIRLSQIAALKMVSTVAVLLLILLIASGTQIGYQSEVIAHFADDSNGDGVETEHYLESILSGAYILTGIPPENDLLNGLRGSFGDSLSSVWEASTGKRVARLIGQQLLADTSYLVSVGQKGAAFYRLNPRGVQRISMHDRERVIAYSNGVAVLALPYGNDALFDPYGPPTSSDTTASDTVVTVATDTMISVVATDTMISVPFVRLRAITLTNDRSEGIVDSIPLGRILAIGEHGSQVLISYYKPDGRESIAIWKPRIDKRIADLAELDTSPLSSLDLQFGPFGTTWRFDEVRGIVVACQAVYAKTVYVWNTRDGKLIHNLSSREDSYGRCDIHFTPQDILISVLKLRERERLPLMMARFSADGQVRKGPGSGDSTYIIVDFNNNPVYLVSSVRPHSVVTWNLHTGAQRRINGISLNSTRKMVLNKDNKHLILLRGRHTVELWDITKGLRLNESSTTQNVIDVKFTLDGRGYMRILEGNRLVFDTLGGSTVLEITDAGGFLRQAYLDSDCGQVNIWTDEGRVLQYRWGIDIPMLKFLPLSRCRERRVQQ
jgi:hypothetical protein